MRRDQPQRPSSRDATRPRSPSEALEPGRPPSRPKGGRLRQPSKPVPGFVRLLSGLLTLSVLGLMIGGGAILFFTHLYDQPGPLESGKMLVIPDGVGSTDIAERLEKEGIIDNRWAFMANYLGQKFALGRNDLKLKHGEYEIKARASMRDVMEVISSGRSVGYRVAAPEGLTSQQLVERMKLDPNLTGEITSIPSEGSLAPDTYSFTKGADRNEIVKRMQDAQIKLLDAAWEKRQQGLPFESKEQALTLASIVEKETGSSDERAKVAAVFVNRLRKNMPLQSDPTILYGLYGGAVQWGKPILQSEKEAKNSHNTYQIKGLPPTPICNPGAAAINAVLNPAQTKDLYFVADGEGGHIFSETLKDHNAAVANWRKVEKDIRAKEAAAKEAEKSKEAAAAPAVDEGPPKSEAAPSTVTTPPRQVVVTVPPEANGDAIPSPSAESEPVAPAVIKPTAAMPASTVPLPVRKPKK
jgi:UPF0755 protein